MTLLNVLCFVLFNQLVDHFSATFTYFVSQTISGIFSQFAWFILVFSGVTNTSRCI